MREIDINQPRDATPGAERVALVDLLDRVLAGGVVVAGEVTLSIADVELVHISLRTLLTSVASLVPTEPLEGEVVIADG